MFVPDQHQVGRLGVNTVERAVVGDLGWIFREVQHTDVGIDAHVELREAQQATGLLLACQIKCGMSWFREAGPHGWTFRPKNPKHVEYWLDYALPVLIVLADLDGNAYWEHVSRSTVRRVGDGWKILVPRSQRLDVSSRPSLRQHAVAGGLRLNPEAGQLAQIISLLLGAGGRVAWPEAAAPGVGPVSPAAALQALLSRDVATRVVDVDSIKYVPTRSAHALRQSAQELLQHARDAIKDYNADPTFLSGLVAAGLGHVEVLLGYRLPNTSARVDVVLCGAHPTTGEPSYVLIQLARWRSAPQLGSAGLIRTENGRLELNPLRQVGAYVDYLTNTVDQVRGGAATLIGAAYSGNVRFAEAVAVVGLGGGLCNELYCADGLQALLGELVRVLDTDSRTRADAVLAANALLQESTMPSAPLMDAIGGGARPFTLLDDQQVAIELALDAARRAVEGDGKTVIIVTGAAGSGKSLVALQMMKELTGQGRSTLHATGSSSFTSTLRKVVERRPGRASSSFVYFNGFVGAPESAVDVLICDEAHRVRRTSVNRFTRERLRLLAVDQVDELVRVARVCVFLIDEDQVVRPGEIGSVAMFEAAARAHGREVLLVRLEGEHRNSGSEFYKHWLNALLGNDPSATVPWRTLLAHTRDTFEVGCAASIKALDDWLLEKQRARGGSARLTAGYCWPWNDPIEQDGVRMLPADVRIGEWSRPWAAKPAARVPDVPASHFWASDVRGVGQVGLIYTAQGFEYNWAGVILGEDFVRRGDRWVARRDRSADPAAKRAGDVEFETFARNTYRVLATRGTQGVCFFSVDEETRHYLHSMVLQ